MSIFDVNTDPKTLHQATIDPIETGEKAAGADPKRRIDEQRGQAQEEGEETRLSHRPKPQARPQSEHRQEASIRAVAEREAEAKAASEAAVDLLIRSLRRPDDLVALLDKAPLWHVEPLLRDRAKATADASKQQRPALPTRRSRGAKLGLVAGGRQRDEEPPLPFETPTDPMPGAPGAGGCRSPLRLRRE